MTNIAPGSIGLGPIPFNLFIRGSRSTMTLFCRTGYPITQRHMEILDTRRAGFFISSDQLDPYLDYSFDRLEKIVTSDQIRIRDKAEILHKVGIRTVRKLLKDPRSGEAVEHTKKLAENYTDLIIRSPEAASNLLALSATDSYTFSHSVNACTFSLLIGSITLGMDRDQLTELGTAGLMHDVGKTRIDEAILNKPGRLTDEEMEVMRKHSVFSYEIVQAHNMSQCVLLSARSHHERLDGSGYPDGLREDQIHPYAKIVAVADVYDAITTNRVYKEEKSHIHALEEMAEMEGKFDPRVFDALLTVVFQNDCLIEAFRNKTLLKHKSV